ncbi:terminase [Bacillus sp. AFS002410]|uniref:terminase small subunit n=1 Tax=Bacillus sp. AFS002410 TaxID=2033481 RepID=UPI000BEFDCA3|nr:terminase small subunit [Bacillus sp. AFS002410]PEJ57413.1 terminase [Bacillus sp. AFS002410]
MNWDVIRNEYKTTDITLAALAEKHHVKLGTLKSRKSRESWTRGSPKDATKPKKVATPKKKDATIKQVVLSEELTDKQKLFCLYYLKYFNATKAYQKAYECTYEIANKNAYTLMVNHGIKDEINRLKNERLNGVLLDAQSILQKYIDIAFADITDFVEFGKKEISTGDFDESGNPITYTTSYVDFKESSEIDGTLITEVKKGKDGVSVKLADKMRALEFLTKYTDLLSQNDLKKLQQEKLKAEIAKTKQETKLLDPEDNGSNDDVIDNFNEATKPSAEAMKDVFGDENED